jgi:hypothetical protein
VKFESCLHNREVVFVSSDPAFSVRSDGSVYVEQEVANLSKPVQFMVTARGLRDTRIWETTVKLAVAGHAPSIPLTQVAQLCMQTNTHTHTCRRTHKQAHTCRQGCC